MQQSDLGDIVLAAWGRGVHSLVWRSIRPRPLVACTRCRQDAHVLGQGRIEPGTAKLAGCDDAVQIQLLTVENNAAAAPQRSAKNIVALAFYGVKVL